MKERYSRFMDNITPERSDEELFRTVLAKADKKEKIKMTEKKILKKAVVIPVAVAMALTLSIAGGAAIYSGFSHLRQSEIAQSPDVAQSIQTEVFSDSTEHIKMTVEEYVSDGITAFATVKYEALDDIGRNWLSYKNFDNDLLCLKPCTVEYGSRFGGVSHSYGNFEIEELRTESERYFYIEMNCNSDAYDGGIVLVYTTGMGGSLCELPMEKCTVDIKSFTLSGNEQASEYFTPTHLKISDLSFTIYGMQNGIYESWRNERGNGVKSLLPDEEDYALHNNLTIKIVTADGKKIDLEKTGWALGSAFPSEENFNTDLIIYSGNFIKIDDEQGKWINYSIDFGEIAGIEICGVYFEATEIE